MTAKYQIQVRKNDSGREYEVAVHRIPMRDGVRLCTLIYTVPGQQTRCDVLLERSPYHDPENLPACPPDFPDVRTVLIRQHCRGTGSSEGDFTPWNNHEREDALDTVAWLWTQPWFSGRLGLCGGSYCAHTQMQLAVTGCPELVSFRPCISPAGIRSSMFVHGAFYYYMYMEWALTMFYQLNVNRRNPPDWYARGVIHALPLNEVDRAAGFQEPVPYLRQWLENAGNPSFWEPFEVENAYDQVNAPAYFYGGWFDIFIDGTLRNFRGIRQFGQNEKTRRHTRCVIGPWVHSGLLDPELFGGQNTPENCYAEKALQFTRNLFADPESDPLPGEPPLRYFMMGSNQWCSAETWPPENSRNREFFLHSHGSASSLAGDGELVSSVQDGAPDTFVYDPRNPVPSGGGDTPRPGRWGCTDQRFIEERADVLVYTSEVLAVPVKTAGPIVVELWVESDVPCTDFTAKLTDVYPDGRSMYLCSGIQRIEVPRTGEPFCLRIEAGHTANSFEPGHRIRLEISSSDFPRFDRNLNTGGNFASDSECRTARQTVHHSRVFPSRLILTVPSF